VKRDEEAATEQSPQELVDQLDEVTTRRLLADAAMRDEETRRAVRLAAAGAEERLEVLRAEVDSGLRTRRHLGYLESSEWAGEARPVVAALAEAVEAGPSRELVELLQRAVGNVVKVILRADDSNGMIGDLARDLLELHADVCRPGVADPVELAKWMVKFCFVDQDFFEVDPVRYAPALGDKGLAVYRREVAARSETSDRFASRYAAERLAILDRDVSALVELLGGDLTSPHQFQRVADAMLELDLPDDALRWALDGIERTSGWQVAKLYDLAAGLLSARGDVAGVLRLRREQHERMSSATTYGLLRSAAETTGEWEVTQAEARAVLGARDPGGLVDVLLADGEAEAGWTLATTEPVEWEVGEHRWKRLAEVRAVTHPADAMAVWFRLVDEVLISADKRSYQGAVRYLKAAKKTAAAADAMVEFDVRVAGLRETHRRRPSLIAMLDKAGFG
jgi:hypothetical protein